MPIKGRKINIFESKKWVFGFLGTLFFSHAFFSAQLGSLKGWSGDEWYSYNDFTLMALPFSILTKFQISIIGPLTNVNFIYFKMQGLIWIALIFCLFYNQYFNSFNQSNKKYILFSTLFIGINPFILGQTQFFRYYNLYLLGAFISYYLIKQKGENFNINRKIFYSALIISPLIHFFIFWQLLIYILLKELEIIFKTGQKTKGIIIIFVGILGVFNIDYLLVKFWNFLMHNYNYVSLESIQHRGFSIGTLLKPFNSIFVYFNGRDIIPLEYYSLTIIYILVGLSLAYVVVISFKDNSPTTINLYFSGIIPFLGIYLFLDPLTLPGMTQADAHHGLFIIPWILYLLFKLNKIFVGRIINILLFSSFIYADYLTISKDFLNWDTVEKTINNNKIPIITDTPASVKFHIENPNLIWYQDSINVRNTLINNDTICIIMQGWSNYQTLTMEQKWNSAKGTIIAFGYLKKLLLIIENEGFHLQNGYSNFPLHSMVFVKNKMIPSQPSPYFFDIKYQDLKLPINIGNDKIIGFQKIEFGEEVYVDSTCYYFIQTNDPKIGSSAIQAIKFDGTSINYIINDEKDTYRSYFCRSINGDEIVYSFKKKPLVSNSMKYPGSVFNSELRVFKFSSIINGLKIKPLSPDITIYVGIINQYE